MRPAPRWVVSALLALALSTPARSQTSVQALLRERGEAFVAAMNSPGGEALAAFARDHLGSRLVREGLVETLVDRMREHMRELGRLTDPTIQIIGDGAVVFVYCKSSTSGAWFNYQFRVLPEDGHRLELVFRAVAMEPMPRPSTPLSNPASRAWLARYVAELERQHPFAGVAVVRQGGSEIYGLVQGPADAERRKPIQRTTRFGMASGSKMFTAVAILQLAQAGKLSLDDTLAEHLPSFPNQAFARRATIHQLLTHTAAAGNYWDDAYERQWQEITRLDQMLPHVLRHLDESPPGEHGYSNSGYILLGLVIEAVSGESYYDFVQRRILTPAGMTSTGFPLRSQRQADEALPYAPRMDAGAVVPGVYLPVVLGERGTSAGGAAATADDLLRFVDALRDGLLLDAHHYALLVRPQVAMTPSGSQHYGYGTILEQGAGGTSWGHGGTAPGTQFELRVYPELDAVLVVLSNYGTIGAVELASTLDHLLRNTAQ